MMNIAINLNLREGRAMKDRNKDLEGKVAIVTGSGIAGGMGLTIARVLAEAGAKVVLTDIKGAELEESTKGLKKDGLDVVHHIVDISDEKSVEELIEFTLNTFGRINIVVNNAACTSSAEDTDIMSMPVELWDNTMAINTRGTMLMCKHTIPVLIKEGGGSIINFSSGTSMAGAMQNTAYACSKGAINTLTAYVATQYGDKGVRCNALALGLVGTSKLQETLPKVVQDLFAAHHVVGRIGQTSDVAEFVRFLASDYSTWVTGQVLPVDGGFFAHLPTTVGLAELMTKMER
jgi:NAD(P)-dependent dehydrogenase (short-subunit alcohol dehydrogenase family)